MTAAIAPDVDVDLERLFEESLPCRFPPDLGGCDAPAEWRCTCRHCGIETLLCTAHLEWCRERTRETTVAVCARCGSIALLYLEFLWSWRRL